MSITGLRALRQAPPRRSPGSFPFPVNPSTARYPKLALLARSRLLTSSSAKRGRSRAAGCPTGESPAHLLPQMCDWPARSRQSLRDCRRNELRQTTNFASRLKRISRSSPLTKNISLSFFPKLMSLGAVPPHMRGASRSSRTLRRDAVGVSMLQRGCHADERHRCARSSRVVPIPRRWYQIGGNARALRR
jgi:hypothetical protein